jgi:hypothetical protein
MVMLGATLATMFLVLMGASGFVEVILVAAGIAFIAGGTTCPQTPARLASYAR